MVRQIKNELDTYKITSYKTYLSEINSNDSSLWQATKRILSSPTVIPPLSQNVIHYQSDREKCEVFADFFENAFTPNDNFDSVTSNTVEESLKHEVSTVELPIKYATPSELQEIVKRLPIKKSPGPDLIPNVLLKHLTRKALAFLTSIVNSCLSKSYFPQSWKKAEIIVIHKPNKPKHQPSS